jgi:type I restriction enzyme S subunit
MGNLPESWIEIPLENCVDILDNKRIPVNADERRNRIGSIPYYGATGQVGWIDDYIFDEELLLLGEDGAPFFDKSKSIAYLISGKSWVNNHAHVLRALEFITSNKFLKYYLDQFDFTGFVNGTTRLKLNQGNLKKIPIYLPSLPEQKSIVKKLEKLLAEVETAQERLEKIPQILKRFRQSVLIQAVTGELTKDWRKENNIDYDWKETTVSEIIIDKPRNGYSPKSVNYETPVKSLTLTATTSGKFKPECFKYIDEPIDKNSHLWLKTGDILIQRSNSIEYVGVSAIYDEADNSYIYPDLMMKVKANEKVITEYLFYSLSSEKIRSYFRQNATGTAGNMPKINQGTVMNAPISIPLIEEQQEIVKRVKELFEKADRIEERYKKAKSFTDKLTQSILNKAFKGELVTQDSSDETASVLLERIKAAQ